MTIRGLGSVPSKLLRLFGGEPLHTVFNPPAAIISSLALTCIALLMVGFVYGLRRTNLPRSIQGQAQTILISGMMLWTLVVGWLSYRGFFSDFTALPPRLLFALLLPAVALTIANYRSRTLSEALSHTPISWLFYLQTFRVLVELILWRGYKVGNLPIDMTFDGRNFDIVAGLTAPVIGWLWQRTRNRLLGIVWNFAGLALLLNIVVVAILCMPTPLRIFKDGPANTLLTQFPFIYLPAILVPIAYTAHILSLRQLWSQPAFKHLFKN